MVYYAIVFLSLTMKKKFLITSILSVFCAAASMLAAQTPDELTLRYGFDFEGPEQTLGGMGGYNVTNSALEENQGDGVLANIDGYRNYAADGIEGSRSARQNGGNMQITEMGMSASSGITIAMAYDTNNLTNARLWGCDLWGQSRSVVTGGSDSSLINLYYGAGLSVDVTGAAGSYNAMVMTASSDGVNTLVTLSIYDSSGLLLDSGNVSLDGVLTMNTFQLGANSKDTDVDNVLIYEGAADINQSQLIASTLLTTGNISDDSPLQYIIPEPGTASLSLVAFVSLLARRRRKAH